MINSPHLCCDNNFKELIISLNKLPGYDKAGLALR